MSNHPSSINKLPEQHSPLLKLIDKKDDDSSYKTLAKKVLISTLPIFFVYFTSFGERQYYPSLPQE